MIGPNLTKLGGGELFETLDFLVFLYYFLTTITMGFWSDFHVTTT